MNDADGTCAALNKWTDGYGWVVRGGERQCVQWCMEKRRPQMDDAKTRVGNKHGLSAERDKMAGDRRSIGRADENGKQNNGNVPARCSRGPYTKLDGSGGGGGVESFRFVVVSRYGQRRAMAALGTGDTTFRALSQRAVRGCRASIAWRQRDGNKGKFPVSESRAAADDFMHFSFLYVRLSLRQNCISTTVPVNLKIVPTKNYLCEQL